MKCVWCLCQQQISQYHVSLLNLFALLLLQIPDDEMVGKLCLTADFPEGCKFTVGKDSTTIVILSSQKHHITIYSLLFHSFLHPLPHPIISCSSTPCPTPSFMQLHSLLHPSISCSSTPYPPYNVLHFLLYPVCTLSQLVFVVIHFQELEVLHEEIGYHRLSIFCSYWMINKTDLTVQYKVRTSNTLTHCLHNWHFERYRLHWSFGCWHTTVYFFIFLQDTKTNKVYRQLPTKDTTLVFAEDKKVLRCVCVKVYFSGVIVACLTRYVCQPSLSEGVALSGLKPSHLKLLETVSRSLLN